MCPPSQEGFGAARPLRPLHFGPLRGRRLPGLGFLTPPAAGARCWPVFLVVSPPRRTLRGRLPGRNMTGPQIPLLTPRARGVARGVHRGKEHPTGGVRGVRRGVCGGAGARGQRRQRRGPRGDRVDRLGDREGVRGRRRRCQQVPELDSVDYSQI